jgi:hypothetical protein
VDRRIRQTLLIVAFLVPTFACDSDDDAADGASAPAPAGGDAAPADEGSAPAAAKATTAGPRTYPKDARKQKCDALTNEFVAELFEFPVDRLKPEDPSRKKKCRFSWNHEGQTFFAHFGSLSVKKDEDRAKLWFKNQTESKTQEQVEADAKQIAEKLGKEEKLDSPTAKATTKTAMNAFAGMTTDGVTWNDVPGLGDEARVNDSNGIVRIRDGNALIWMSAYLVPEEPPYTGPPTDISAITAHNRKWIQETIEQRKAASIKLARAYLPEVQKLAQ